MAKYRVLVACGTAIATATVVATYLEKLFKSKGVDAEVIQSKTAEAGYWIKMGKIDLVVGTTKVLAAEEAKIPVLNGIPYLTGGPAAEALDKKVLETLGIEER